MKGFLFLVENLKSPKIARFSLK